MSEEKVDKVTLIGNNCGNCKRGNKSMETEECIICRQVEEQEGKKFTKWEKKQEV